MHVPADVWQKLFTHDKPVVQSCAVVQAMVAQPFACDHIGPDVTGAPQR